MESTNDVSQVIDRTALIENILNQIITNHSSPREDAKMFFWTVLLDSSVIALGSKVKVVMSIAKELNVDISPTSLHKLISLRNSFAHHSLNSHPTIYLKKETLQDEFHNTLHVLSQSGSVNKKTRSEALNEFNALFKTCKDCLLALNEKVGAVNSDG